MTKQHFYVVTGSGSWPADPDHRWGPFRRSWRMSVIAETPEHAAQTCRARLLRSPYSDPHQTHIKPGTFIDVEVHTVAHRGAIDLFAVKES